MRIRVQLLEIAQIPFTLPMAKTKAMVLVLVFSFPFSAGFQGKSGFSFGKLILVFAFTLCLRAGVGVFSPPLKSSLFVWVSRAGVRTCLGLSSPKILLSKFSVLELSFVPRPCRSSPLVCRFFDGCFCEGYPAKQTQSELFGEPYCF